MSRRECAVALVAAIVLIVLSTAPVTLVVAVVLITPVAAVTILLTIVIIVIIANHLSPTASVSEHYVFNIRIKETNEPSKIMSISNQMSILDPMD